MNALFPSYESMFKVNNKDIRYLKSLLNIYNKDTSQITVTNIVLCCYIVLPDNGFAVKYKQVDLSFKIISRKTNNKFLFVSVETNVFFPFLVRFAHF